MAVASVAAAWVIVFVGVGLMVGFSTLFALVDLAQKLGFPLVELVAVNFAVAAVACFVPAAIGGALYNKVKGKAKGGGAEPHPGRHG